MKSVKLIKITVAPFQYCIYLTNIVCYEYFSINTQCLNIAFLCDLYSSTCKPRVNVYRCITIAGIDSAHASPIFVHFFVGRRIVNHVPTTSPITTFTNNHLGAERRLTNDPPCENDPTCQTFHRDTDGRTRTCGFCLHRRIDR